MNILNITRNNTQYSYHLTQEDILNLIRAVAHEGEPYEGVAWTLLQRFGLLYPSTFDNFTTFVKAYAQPINPRWFPNGDKHLAYISTLKRSGATSTQIAEAEKRAENRVKYAHETLNEIDPKYVDVVKSIIDGIETNTKLKGSVHYIGSQAPHGIDESQARSLQKTYADNRADLKDPVYYGSAKIGNNWFFNVPGSDKVHVEVSNKMPDMVNFGTPEDPVMAVVLLFYGAAAKKLLDYLGRNG